MKRLFSTSQDKQPPRVRRDTLCHFVQSFRVIPRVQLEWRRFQAVSSGHFCMALFHLNFVGFALFQLSTDLFTSAFPFDKVETSWNIPLPHCIALSIPVWGQDHLSVRVDSCRFVLILFVNFVSSIKFFRRLLPRTKSLLLKLSDLLLQLLAGSFPVNGINMDRLILIIWMHIF